MAKNLGVVGGGLGGVHEVAISGQEDYQYRLYIGISAIYGHGI